MKLAFGLKFSDIQSSDNYSKLTQKYNSFSGGGHNDDLVQKALILQRFLSQLFGIDQHLEGHRTRASEQRVVHKCRDLFIRRFALPNYSGKDLGQQEQVIKQAEAILPGSSDYAIASYVMGLLADEEANKDKLDILARYAVIKISSGANVGLFRQWQRLDDDNKLLPSKIQQARDELNYSYNFRDKQITAVNSTDQANYCILCHSRHLDSCRTGLERKQKPGCPLKQKISEMNQLRQEGDIIAALAVIMLDNPLLPLTGHRICNDCMQSCIFQKQEPVNVPVTESEILQAVLKMPYGFEVYNLLAWWNPLRAIPISQISGKRVMVAGSGPSGIAASYYFLLSGHQVTMLEGMPIKELTTDITMPIRHWQGYIKPLDEWLANGFGGVAEYGITHRFDKNNLLIVRILLQRRRGFNLIGACRLGSNITIKQAFNYFDHISLCVGSGKPRYLPQKEYFSKQIIAANEFLMRLHIENSFHENSRPRFLLKLPVIIIGCGLTAIDSAVEAMQYYPRQVANIAKRHARAISAGGLDNLSDYFSRDELESLEQFLDHHQQLEGKSSQETSRLLQEFGGVKICYHKDVKQSPAYKRNHEEIEQALAIGVELNQNHIISKMDASEIEFSHNGVIKRNYYGTIMLAIGVDANKFIDLYGDFDKNGEDRFFKTADQRISYFGDANQHYNGSVVKAIASVKDGYQLVNKALSNHPINQKCPLKDDQLSAIIIAATELSPKNWHLIVASKLPADNYQAGQIFRLSFAEFHYTLAPIKVDKNQGTIEFLLQNKQLPTLMPGDSIQLMGPVGSGLNPSDSMVLLFANHHSLPPMIGLYNSLKATNHVKLYCLSQQPIKTVAEDVDINYISSIELGGILPIVAATDAGVQVISALDNAQHLRLSQQIKNMTEAKLLRLSGARMLCMMKGICGSCLSFSPDSGYYFACEQQFN